MAYADTIRNAQATLETVATSIDGVLGSSGGLTISSWSPSYSGTASMTYGTMTVDWAYYFQLNEAVFFVIVAVGTTGGTASTGLTASLPVNTTASYGPSVSASWRDTTVSVADLVGRGSINITDDTIEVYKNDNANWGLGANSIMRASGWYLTSDPA